MRTSVAPALRTERVPLALDPSASRSRRLFRHPSNQQTQAPRIRRERRLLRKRQAQACIGVQSVRWLRQGFEFRSRHRLCCAAS